jgi:hypothetical protein
MVRSIVIKALEIVEKCPSGAVIPAACVALLPRTPHLGCKPQLREPYPFDK